MSGTLPSGPRTRPAAPGDLTGQEAVLEVIPGGGIRLSIEDDLVGHANCLSRGQKPERDCRDEAIKNPEGCELPPRPSS